MEKQALYIVTTLQTAGFQAVYAGGYVRDMLLNVPSNDIDIATSATPEEIEQLFKKTIATGKNFGVIVVVIDNIEIEVATFRKDIGTDGRRPDSVELCSMKEDAFRRDFTINGLFYDPISKEIFDFVNGKEDLKNGIVKFIGDAEQRINEDYLRMLRFVRFSARFGTCDSESLEAVKNNASKINLVSKERIQDEICKMLKIGQPRKIINLLLETTIIHEILPEIELLKDTVQDKQWHPEGSVLNHTLLVMESLVGEDIALQLAGMFHDIGKPATTKKEENGKISSKEHAKYGADITRNVFKRLKFSNDITELVCKLVYDHMKIIVVPDMSKAKQKRFFAEEHFGMLLKLHAADRMGGCNRTDTLEAVKKLIEQYASEPVKPEYFVNGRDLIDLGIKQGKLIGKIKEEIYDMQLEGKFNSKEDAYTFAKEYVKSL